MLRASTTSSRPSLRTTTQESMRLSSVSVHLPLQGQSWLDKILKMLKSLRKKSAVIERDYAEYPGRVNEAVCDER